MFRIALTAAALLYAGLCAAQEVCNNGVDDDGNGLIDLNDPGCPCSVMALTQGTTSYIRNHSFEEQVQGPNGPCCPYSWSDAVDYLQCADGWHQATQATSDYYHSCGFYPATYPFPPPDGEGCLGFLTIPDWYEYVGTCLMLPANDPHPLLAGNTYTLSLWMTMFSSTEVNGTLETYGEVFDDPYPLALYGHTNCQPFPLPTTTCVGDLPGWVELGRVIHDPDGAWAHVSFTFSLTTDIRTVVIGAACDVPASYTVGQIMGPNGMVASTPYTLVDDLMLTLAGDQAVTPVTAQGNLCTHDVRLAAVPPPTATNHQWYLDGVALPGQNGLTLDASAVGLGAGHYTLASDLAGQCLMGIANVLPQPVPVPLLAADPLSGCAPLTVAFADTSGPSMTHTAWDFGDNSTATGRDPSHTYTAAGTYSVTLSVTNAAGCANDSTYADLIVVHPSPHASIAVLPQPLVLPTTTAQLSGTATTGDIVSWWWDLGSVPPGEATGATITTDFPATPGTYPVRLAVRTTHGCVDTVWSNVIVRADGAVDMPNVFSPNGDGHNDRFLPLEVDGMDGVLDIYNRWGQLVFTTNALATGWDGRVNGIPAPDGTYYYILHTAPDDRSHTGHITLLR